MVKRQTTKREWPQYLIALQGWLPSFIYAFHMGWVSSFQPLFQSEDSPLDGPPVTDEQLSWIASLPSLFTIIGTPIYGFLIDKLGRKTTGLLCYLPFSLAHIILIFGTTVPLVYVARVLIGLGAAGGFNVFPIYIAETCKDERRGLLNSLVVTFSNLGIIISIWLGGWTSYSTTNTILLAISSIYFIFYFWLPESPVTEKNLEKRLEIVKKLRGTDPECITEELARIQKLLDTNKDNFNFLQLFTDKTNLKSMMIVNVIWALGMTCGYPAIMRYTVDIFDNTGSTISPFVSAIILAISQLVFAFLGACIIDMIGRKSLLIYSTIIMTTGLCSFTIFLYFLPEPVGVISCVPVVALTVYASGYSLGYPAIPPIMVTDLFSPNSQASAMAFGNLLVGFDEFVVTKVYLGMTTLITIEGTFTVFVGSCVLGFLFIYFIVFESRGFLLKQETSLTPIGSDDKIIRNNDVLTVDNDMESKL